MCAGLMALLGCQGVEGAGGESNSDGGNSPPGNRWPAVDGGGSGQPRDADAGLRADGSFTPGHDSGRRAEVGVWPDPDAHGWPGNDAGNDAGHPDRRMSCSEIVLTADLAEDRLHTRNEPVEIIYSAPPGYVVSATAPDGGRIVESGDQRFFSAGGSEPGDLGWPHWTGPVTVEVTATDPETGCAESVSIEVLVAGDVVHGDRESGLVMLYGSDGRYLGRFAQLPGPGVQWITIVPPHDAFAGGLATIIWGPYGEPAQILLLDRQGDILPVQVAMQAFNGEPLYPSGHPPKHLFARDGVLFADYGEGCLIHRWSYAGNYLDAVPGYCEPTGTFHSIGFGVVDGDIVTGRHTVRADLHDFNHVHRLQASSDGLRGIIPGSHGDLVVLTRGGQGRAWAFDRRGDDLGNDYTGQEGITYMTRFMDGYLNVNEYVGIVHRSRDMSIVEHPESRWDQGRAESFRSRGGLAWLDDGTWPQAEP